MFSSKRKHLVQNKELNIFEVLLTLVCLFFFCSAGMSAFFTVENCPESNELPETRSVQHPDDEEDEWNEDYSVNNLYSIVFQHGGPPSILRSGGRRPRLWIHYISAEEVMWDYNPQGDRYDH